MKILKGNPVYTILILISLILIVPALFINLGLEQLINDEAIRGLVALEMKFSGDYLSPTISSDLYFKKPPVYNWLLLLFFNITGDYSEFMIRLPNVLFLLAFTTSIFFIIRKKYNVRVAFLSGMLFLVSGRVLFYEALVGLIDITYSWLIFLNFIFIYDLFQKGKFLKLFLVSYFITALTLLLKGLPSLAFQGITLLVIFISNKQFKRLFSWKHFVGLFPFIILVGGYYYAYYLKNPGSINELLSTFVHESTDKSAISFGLLDIVKHFFSFSFEILYAFVPGTFIIFFLFSKKSYSKIKGDPFLKYISLVFIFNIPVYLVSPVSYLRYLLMLMPLVFITFVVLYEGYRIQRYPIFNFLERLFIVIGAIISFIYIAAPMFPQTGFVDFAWLKAIFLIVVSLLFFYILGIRYKLRLEMIILLLLVVRIGFNLYILPSRVNNDWEIAEREKIIEIGKATKGERLFIYDYAPIHFNYRSLYYLTLGRMEPTENSTNMKEKGYYVVYDTNNDYTNRTIYQFRFIEPEYKLSIVKVD